MKYPGSLQKLYVNTVGRGVSVNADTETNSEGSYDLRPSTHMPERVRESEGISVQRRKKERKSTSSLSDEKTNHRSINSVREEKQQPFRKQSLTVTVTD
jgi:hypothetical protein